MRPTLEQLGLEVRCIATEVDMRALGENKRVRFVEWVTAWGRWELEGEKQSLPWQSPLLNNPSAFTIPRVSGAVGLMCPASSVHSRISR